MEVAFCSLRMLHRNMDQHNDVGYDKFGGTAFASWSLIAMLLSHVGAAAGRCLTEVLVSSLVFSEHQHQGEKSSPAVCRSWYSTAWGRAS